MMIEPSRSIVGGDRSPRVFYHFIDSTSHNFYELPCGLCSRVMRLGRVLAEIFPPTGTRLMVCSGCIDIMYEEKPEDATTKDVQKVKSESSLIRWITSTEQPMDSL